MSFVILNAEYVRGEDARIRTDDRGLLLGDGLFETLRAYPAGPFMLREHLGRLFRSAGEMRLAVPWSQDELTEMVSGLLEKNHTDSARIRITVTRGPHTGAMSLSPAESPTLLITAEPIPEGIEQRMDAGISIITADVRFSENNPAFRHKTTNRLPNLFARTQAESAGCGEALILDERGNVACCSTGNIFAVQYGQLFTPPLGAPILPGVTRGVVLDLARREGIHLREDFFSPIMLAGADEVFMTNSVQEIVPVVEANRRPVGSGKPGPVSARLRELYRGLCRGE